jgi:hypothetical protein
VYFLNGLGRFTNTAALWKPCGNSFVEEEIAQECFLKRRQAARINPRKILIIMALFAYRGFCPLVWLRARRKGDFGHLHRFAAAG